MSSSRNRLYVFGPFSIDVQRRLLLRDGLIMPLPPKAFDTLLVLITRQGEVISKDALIECIWPDSYVEESNLAQNIFVLRKILREAKNDHQYIVTIPGKGYSFVATVQIREAEAVKVSLSENDEQADHQAEKAITSLAVLPFTTLGGGREDKYLGFGLADAIVMRLSGLKNVVVRPTASVLKFGRTDKEPQQIGRELGVDAVLVGLSQRIEDKLRVSVQLIGVEDDKTLWAAKFDEHLTSIFEMQDSISEQVTRVLALKLSGKERSRLKKNYTDNTEAFHFYVKGKYYWNKRTVEGLRQSLKYCHQALELDPTYALAYLGLAECYNLLASHGGHSPRDYFPKAKAAAHRALEIDDTLSEAYASIGFVNYRYEWDWAAAERHFKLVIEAKPNYPTAFQWYGGALVARGRYDEALALLSLAQSLDPLSLPISTDLAQALFFARRYQESRELLRMLLEMDRGFIRAYILAGMIYTHEERYDRAISALIRAVELSSGAILPLSELGYVYAVSGKVSEAQKILRDLEKQAGERYTSAHSIATIYVGLSQREQTLRWLERAYSQRDVWLVWLNANPKFDGLRSDERFLKIIRKIQQTA